jgi:hypothetical protein
MEDERNEVWSRDEQRFDYDNGNGGTYILINGSSVAIEPETNFREAVGEYALNAGFNKYRVYLNGEEVRPSTAPTIINEGDRVEIRAYDAAGC